MLLIKTNSWTHKLHPEYVLTCASSCFSWPWKFRCLQKLECFSVEKHTYVSTELRSLGSYSRSPGKLVQVWPSPLPWEDEVTSMAAFYPEQVKEQRESIKQASFQQRSHITIPSNTQTHTPILAQWGNVIGIVQEEDKQWVLEFKDISERQKAEE